MPQRKTVAQGEIGGARLEERSVICPA